VKRRRKAPTRKPGKPKAQRKPRTREDTPSDAEEMEVDHTTTKMADLTKDIKIGKKFSRHAELKQRERERQQRARVTREMSDPPPDAEEQPSRLPGREAAPEISTGPQMRIINGQIVVDDASLVVDRHAIAAAQATEMEEYEEDDFTRITTSGTYMKRERNITWTLEATEKFYIGLRMFGTDFEMISKMFPDRNRRQIKLKFNKEEREYPKRISNALIGETVKIDFEEYKSHTGLEYETTEDIKAEHAKYEEEHLDEQARLLSEAAEQTRQKRAAISGKLGSAGGTDSAKENDGPSGIGFEDTGKGGKGKKGKVADKKKKKKNLNSVQGGGEEVEVLGTID
jgi:transcription factor TFIIIB component B''